MLVCNEITPHRQNLQYLSCKKVMGCHGDEYTLKQKQQFSQETSTSQKNYSVPENVINSIDRYA